MTNIRTIIAIVVLGIATVGQAQTYPSQLMNHETEINAIIKEITLEEKIAMLHGKNMFSSAGIPRLGIADIEYADGPFGIREEMEPHSWNSLHLTSDSATFFPTGSALAATWSTEWAYAYGRGMSREARLRGKDMILGPAINIQRIPTGGRTYEYLSEDPLLSGMLSVAYTKGSQDDGTAVCLKHYALNNQEDYRGFVDVRISDRAMHDIYLRPFEMAVREADAWGVMAAYNKVNGRWCSENELLLNTILRQQWGFPGMVISDWGGVHSTVDAVTSGMNVEMPGDRFMGKALLDSVKAGKVSEEVINQRVREILRVRLTVKPIAKEKANSVPVGNPEEMKVALEVARRSIVLLKNDGQLLPIDLQRIKSIAVIGENAVTPMALGGVGAGVKTRQEITPLEGLQKVLGDQVKITYVQGYKGFDRQSRNERKSPQQKADPQLLAQAVKAAKKADLVIFFAGDNREVETEGSDRKSITLPSGQDELAEALAKANKRLVTVIVSGGPVDVSVVKEVSGALVASWFNGSMGGQALAEVLTGKISPSGRLPMTWPLQLNDVPAYATKSYPQDRRQEAVDIFVGVTQNRSNDRFQQLIANYAEEDLVGYRWYDCKAVPVAYPFGYGLSYAQFQYSDLKVTPTAEGFDVCFTLTNTSSSNAEEVAQVYVSRPQSHIDRPVKELKGFQRVALKAGERKEVTIPIRRSDLCHCDESAQTWMLEPGSLIIQVGGSSDNLPLHLEAKL